MKQAQMTVFGILALVILIIALIFIFSPKQEVRQVQTVPDIQGVYDLVEACLQDNAEKAVALFVFTGMKLDSERVEMKPFDFAVLIDDGESLLPSMEEMQSDLTRAINQLTFECSEIAMPEFVQMEPPKSVLLIGDDIKIDVDMPVKIKTAVREEQKDRFVLTVPANIPRLRGFAKEIIEKRLNDGSFLSMSSLETDAEVIANVHGENELVFTVIDSKQYLHESWVMMNFAEVLR